MNNKPETSADITAEIRSLSRSAECCELQPKVFGKPIAQYLAELADRIDAANASNVENIGGAAIEAIALLGRIGKTGDGRIHLHDLVNIDNAKARLQTAIAHCEMRSTVRNGDECRSCEAAAQLRRVFARRGVASMGGREGERTKWML